MNVGWSTLFWAANKDAWDSWPPEVQALLTEQYAKLEAEAWQAQIEQDTEALACSTGGECKMGLPASIKLVELTDADRAKSAEIVQSAVLPNWAKRCGAECTQEWNDTVGKAIGIQAPLP